MVRVTKFGLAMAYAHAGVELWVARSFSAAWGNRTCVGALRRVRTMRFIFFLPWIRTLAYAPEMIKPEGG